MAQGWIEQESTWIPSFLRTYESMSSIGANFCVLNVVSEASFYRTLAECTGALHRHDTYPVSVDAPGFKIATFGRRLGVPRSDVERLSIKRLQAHAVDQDWKQPFRDLMYFVPVFQTCRICEICVQSRYHSVVHQIEALDRCVLHGEPLRQVGRQRGRPQGCHRDAGFTSILLDLYKELSPNSEQQGWIHLDQCSAEINSAAERFRRRHRKAAATLLQANSRSDLKIWSLNPAYARNVAMSRFGSLYPERRKATQGEVFTAPLDQADTSEVLDLCPEQILRLAANSRRAADVSGAMDTWKMKVSSVVEDLIGEHQSCFASLRALSWSDVESALLFQFGRLAIKRAEHQWEKLKIPAIALLDENTCEAIKFVYALDSLVHGALFSLGSTYIPGPTFDETCRGRWRWIDDRSLDLIDPYESAAPFNFEPFWDRAGQGSRYVSNRVGLALPSKRLADICDALSCALIPMWLSASAAFARQYSAGNDPASAFQDRSDLIASLCVQFSPVVIFEASDQGLRCEVIQTGKSVETKFLEGDDMLRCDGEAVQDVQKKARAWEAQLHADIGKFLKR